jgi:hypothetical protein
LSVVEVQSELPPLSEELSELDESDEPQESPDDPLS